MKLLMCIECRDVRRIQPERTHCQCGQAWANYETGSDRNVVANNRALIIGLNGTTLTVALERKVQQPTESFSLLTFLLPEPCTSVRRVKDAER